MKLAAALEEQMNVADAALKGEEYTVARKAWVNNEAGEKVLVDRMRKVRAWFFEQGDGWYVQCKYGNKALALADGNAVFVKALRDVKAALVTLKAAAEAGELDEVIENTIKKREKMAAQFQRSR
ncbi:hypothetical protein [uncultured Ruegeria sp.]|uniref:hypothetical protein n=1 Tax=uncultured Ruegeria sp. TaxID=259304 RepID=UPI002608B4D2|nr:hypothetical protein [uncultured Ruegeria sp.]